MDKAKRKNFSWYALLTSAVLLLAVAGCGGQEKEIPKEERGEPNVLPEEIVRYREAREAFREWAQLFDADRGFAVAYGRLSRSSITRLRQEGVTDATSFERWFTERANAGLAPFHYVFSRFDILDIEMRDSTEALLTGTFLVQVHNATFESVGTFKLRRQSGRWVVPFAESGNYESSWWQKERQFSTRVREEGTSSYFEQKQGYSFRYPISWDVVTRKSMNIPTLGSGLNGVELTYIDPTTLLPTAVLRIAILQIALPDSVLQALQNNDTNAPVQLSRDAATISEGNTMTGKLSILADALNNRQIAVLAVVDEKNSFQLFSQTFESIISSIVTNKVTE